MAPVYLHVYDLLPEGVSNAAYIANGMAPFHAAVEVYGTEYFYGLGGGVCYVAEGPGRDPNYMGHRDPIPLGHTQLSEHQVRALLSRMAGEWRGDEYSLLSKNCCNFARAFLEELGAEPMPEWVDRAPRKGVESAVSRGVQAAGNAGVRVVATRAAASTFFDGAAGPAGWAAWGGELLVGRVGGAVGEAVAGDEGHHVGENVGGFGGSVGAGAAVGGLLAGPPGAGIGAGIGVVSFAIGKAAKWAVGSTDANQCATTCAAAALRGSISSSQSFQSTAVTEE